MKIILTSFRDANNWAGDKFSIARWQPKGMSYPSLQYLAPYFNGNPMRHLEPNDFRAKYETVLLAATSRFIPLILLSMSKGEDLVFLCWCNPDRQKSYDKLYCHRILVGYWIEQHFPDIEIIYADGANNPIWEKKMC